MSNLRGAHLLVGLLGFIAFVVTGQYMALAGLREMPDAPRLMYRSAHIYLFFGAMLNLLLAAYLQQLAASAARRLQWIGSAIMLAIPVLLLLSFFFESRNQDPLSRPIGAIGIYLSLLGVALHLVAPLANKASTREQA